MMTLPSASTPWTWKTDLAMSRPIACLAPPNCGGLNSPHIHGTHVPVEEPSTASKADIRCPERNVSYEPKADTLVGRLCRLNSVEPNLGSIPARLCSCPRSEEHTSELQ